MSVVHQPKIQVDPESHNDIFEEFEVENELKNDHTFEELEEEKKFKSIRKVKGRSNSSKTIMSSKSSKMKTSSKKNCEFQDQKIQVDPESRRPVEQFKDDHKFKNDYEFQEFEDDHEFQRRIYFR